MNTKEFNFAVTKMIYSSRVLKFIYYHLLRYNLSKSYEAFDIFNTAYWRGYNNIKNGGSLSNRNSSDLEPWFRITCLNIIREISRDRNRLREIPNLIIQNEDFPGISISSVENYYGSDCCDCELNWLSESLKILKPLDRKIIDFRVFKEMKWRQIWVELEFLSKKEGVNSEVSLRQRFSRLLKSLKKSFLDSQNNNKNHE